MPRSTLKTRGLQWHPDPERGPGVLGWDTGKSEGAFCFLYLDQAQGEPAGYIWQRPKFDLQELSHIHWHLRDAVEHCVIEKVNVITDVDGDDGKVRRKGKLAGFKQGFEMALPELICCALEIPYTIVQATKWQKGLGIYVKGEDYTVRKKRYAQIAKEDPLAPHLVEGVTNGNADGLLIARYALENIQEFRSG